MTREALGLYIHIPFCRVRCRYCDFNTYAGLEQLIPEYTSALVLELQKLQTCLNHSIEKDHLTDSRFCGNPSCPVAHGTTKYENMNFRIICRGGFKTRPKRAGHRPAPTSQYFRSNDLPGQVSLLRKQESTGHSKHALCAKSIYFGGGTPSLLSYENLRLILESCRTSIDIVNDAEVTMEANPGTLDRGYLKNLKNIGVNRLSLGVQSFDNRLLKILGRLHDASEAREAYIEARKAGFDNINLDLMYGLPAQTLKQWENCLKEALELEPDHLSLYALTLDEGTPLYTDIMSDKISAPDSDLAADMYSLAEGKLEKAGYVHYEISNWAKPGMESRHNLNYWQNSSYIGIGAGAHSYFNRERFWNIAHPQEYIRRIKEDGRAVAGKEFISPEIEQADYIILGLRLQAGLDLHEFNMRYGDDITQLYGDQISYMKQACLLEETDRIIRLTPRGRLLGNEVFQRFLPKIRV